MSCSILCHPFLGERRRDAMSHKTGLWVTGAIGLVIASLAMTALTAAVVNGVIQPMKTVRPLDLRCEQVPNNAACQNQSAVRTDAARSTDWPAANNVHGGIGGSLHEPLVRRTRCNRDGLGSRSRPRARPDAGG